MGPCLVGLFLAVSACDDVDAAEPESVLVEFLEAMERSRRDPGVLREVYELLDQASRVELAARAERANTLSGREFEPWEMLAQGRFRLRFAPARSGGMRARVDGDDAVVVVRGDQEGKQVSVPMRREAGAWRVVMQLPSRGPTRQ